MKHFVGIVLTGVPAFGKVVSSRLEVTQLHDFTCTQSLLAVRRSAGLAMEDAISYGHKLGEPLRDCLEFASLVGLGHVARKIDEHLGDLSGC